MNAEQWLRDFDKASSAGGQSGGVMLRHLERSLLQMSENPAAYGLSRAELTTPGGAAADGSAADAKVSRGILDALLAPQLPLLLTRGYEGCVRQMLPKLRTESERAALLLLNNYVIGAYEEMEDSLADLQV